MLSEYLFFAYGVGIISSYSNRSCKLETLDIFNLYFNAKPLKQPLWPGASTSFGAIIFLLLYCLGHPSSWKCLTVVHSGYVKWRQRTRKQVSNCSSGTKAAATF